MFIGIIHKSPPMDPILSQINPVHILISYFSNSHLKTFSLSKLLSHIRESLSMDLTIFQTWHHRWTPCHLLAHCFAEQACHLLARCFAELFYDPEDGGDTFLRNVGYHSTHYTASFPRRRYSSMVIYLYFNSLSLLCNYFVSSVALRRFMPFS
jgi:hypothetical protein